MAVQVELFGKSFEFDSDHEQPFFFHPDPGPYNVTLTVPTSDIWKKFELRLLTPPRSPSRCESPKPSELTSVADTLQIVSEILDDTCTSPTVLAPVEVNGGNLKSKLIQDCMWNCSNFETLDFKVPIEECYETPCSTPPPVEYDSSDCVDPAAVFPYPINDTTTSIASTGSDSEEEIDVVTIEKPRRKNQSVNQPPAKRLRPTLTRQKSTSPSDNSSKQTKRSGRQSSGEEDEVEDLESKRATHNVLERKRRNDLKFSFHTLRSELPEVQENERAPKVVILRQGADYIKKLKTEEVKLLAELDKLRKRNQELLDKQSRLVGRKRKPTLTPV